MQNLTEVMGETLDLSRGSKNKYHSSALTIALYYKVLGESRVRFIEVHYWRENGIKTLFNRVCEKYGGKPSDWEAIYAGKRFPHGENAGSIHDFFEGRVLRESLLHFYYEPVTARLAKEEAERVEAEAEQDAAEREGLEESDDEMDEGERSRRAARRADWAFSSLKWKAVRERDDESWERWKREKAMHDDWVDGGLQAKAMAAMKKRRAIAACEAAHEAKEAAYTQVKEALAIEDVLVRAARGWWAVVNGLQRSVAIRVQEIAKEQNPLLSRKEQLDAADGPLQEVLVHVPRAKTEVTRLRLTGQLPADHMSEDRWWRALGYDRKAVIALEAEYRAWAATDPKEGGCLRYSDAADTAATLAKIATAATVEAQASHAAARRVAEEALDATTGAQIKLTDLTDDERKQLAEIRGDWCWAAGGLLRRQIEKHGQSGHAETLWGHVLKLHPTKRSDDEAEDAWWRALGESRKDLAEEFESMEAAARSALYFGREDEEEEAEAEVRRPLSDASMRQGGAINKAKGKTRKERVKEAARVAAEEARVQASWWRK